MTALAAIALGAWVYLLLGHGRFWQAGPVLAPAQPSAAPPAVSVIVPARDEAEHVGAALRSLLAQTYPGALRVILVDDGSTDGTGEIARAIADPRLQVVTGAARPEGWSGKLWALAQGVAQAEGDLLLLTDADILHDPAHLSALVAQMEAGRFDLVSEMVALRCESAAERLLVPAFVFFFAMLYPFAWVNDPGMRSAAAAGGTVLIRASALAASGGIAGMRHALIDDVTLAQRIKRRGRIWLGHSGLAASLRPYPRAADVWRMVARTAYVQLRFSPLWLLGTVLGMALVFAAPPAAVAFGHGRAAAAGAAAWALMSLAYAPTLRRFGLSALRAPLLPAAAMFYVAATLGSAYNHYSGRGVVWKRRAYS